MRARTTIPGMTFPGPIPAQPRPPQRYVPLARVLAAILRAAVAPERATLDVVGIALIAVGLGIAIGVGWALVAAGAAFVLLRLAQVPPPPPPEAAP